MYHATIDKVHTFTGYYNEDSHSDTFKWVSQCSCGWIHLMGSKNGPEFCHWSTEATAKHGYKNNHLDKLGINET